jgi:hypothetical protein
VIQRKQEREPCSTPNCPYGEAIIKGLCRNCYGWLYRWRRVDTAHWKKFVQSFELRHNRITQLKPQAFPVVWSAASTRTICRPSHAITGTAMLFPRAR